MASEDKAVTEEELSRNTALAEAALYVSGRPLTLETIGSIIGVRSKRKTLAVARKLAEKYREKKGALEVVELSDGRFVLQLKPDYVQKVRRLATRPLLALGPLRTLAYIAYRQPVPQAQVIAVRGQHSYKHVRLLLEMGLVRGEKLGKTRVLRTTDIFADYFNFSKDTRLLKRQLQAMFKPADTEGKG